MGRSYSEKMRARQRAVPKSQVSGRPVKKENKNKEGFPFVPVAVISVVLMLIFSTVVLYFLQNSDEDEDPGDGHDPNGDDDTADVLPQLLIGIETVDRGVITLKEHIGKVVVIDMFATWCSPCRQQMYELVDLRSRFAGSQVVIISVDADLSETLSQIRDFKEGYPGADWTFAASNADLNSYFPASSIPTMFILDGNGRTAATHVGLTSADDIASEIEDLL
ncbi:MAG: TlpA family protein disulfide reductase [Candidatus Thermoplasmatota archaeon]|nr:TlpA family protein disulfide reductase [Candidatus Thermoplasmatota archaeon]